MLEVNPQKVKKADIIIGIPSYNEADNIANVVKVIDAGLLRYFKNKKSAIINVDNHSSDKTKQVFLKTETKVPKIYISTPKNIKGKGNNLRNLFLKSRELSARAGATVDADLRSINPQWIKCLISPILRGYDYLTPVYHRHKYDGSITNHICYPLIYGLLACDIRQPIGGDTGFSKKMLKYWLDQEWSDQARDFGIDIFMTLNAIKSKGKLGQVNLISKIHKPSAPKLNKMFLEVAAVLFQFLTDNEALWKKKKDLKKIPVVCRAKGRKEYQKLDFSHEKIEQKLFSAFKGNYKNLKSYIPKDLSQSLEGMFLKEKSLEIDNKLWPEIVYQLLLIYKISPDKESVTKLLRVLYFARIVYFIKKTSDKTEKQAESIIKNTAKQFFQQRKYLLSLQGL